MTRLEQLANKITDIIADHKVEIDNLPTRGPRGGGNAGYIAGWTHLGNQTITKACHLAGCPTMPFWTGSYTTPARAIPECLAKEAEAAYKRIFGK